MRGCEIGRGVRSTVWVDEHGTAVKIPFPDVPLNWLAEEVRLTNLATGAGGPTPGRCRMIEVDGRPALAQRYVPGPTMAQELAEDVTRAPRLGVELAGIQASIASAVPSVALPAQRDRIVAKVHTAARHHGADLLGALELLPPDDQPLVLCHGDLHPGNVIRSPDGDVLVDWFDAGRGTTAAEVARTMVMLRWTASTKGGALGDAFDTLADAYLAAAGARSPLAPGDLAAWQTVQLIARLAEGFGASELSTLRRRLTAALAAR